MVYLTPTDALWCIFGDKEDTHVQIKLGKVACDETKEMFISYLHTTTEHKLVSL